MFRYNVEMNDVYKIVRKYNKESDSTYSYTSGYDGLRYKLDMLTRPLLFSGQVPSFLYGFKDLFYAREFLDTYGQENLSIGYELIIYRCRALTVQNVYPIISTSPRTMWQHVFEGNINVKKYTNPAEIKKIYNRYNIRVSLAPAGTVWCKCVEPYKIIDR